MHNLFTITYKAEMPRFNDACMNGPNPYLMKFMAVCAKEGVVLNCFSLTGSIV
ncbi:hypothetical protein SDC9_172886 [bioreactor metagenome]|uniref:Uncharacterized protein n=1 Tax=bioreactor metagenome TaxID=1076179 RepID=A0A645GEY4_9ZZZZ